jgi:hypothetical protein
MRLRKPVLKHQSLQRAYPHRIHHPPPIISSSLGLSHTRACPFCGEMILAIAKKCRFCGEFVDSEAKAERPSRKRVEPPIERDPHNGVGMPGAQQRLTAGELKESGTVTALSVIGLVFGLIGMLGSFVPCLGALAFYIGIPAALVSGIGLGVAYNQNAKRTFAIVALTISLIGVVISGWQYSSIISAGEEAQQSMQRGLPP